MTLPLLYKLDSLGKTRIWEIFVSDTEIHINHGALGSKITSISLKTDEPEKEALSRWHKQVDRLGYSETVPTEVPRLPMLCHQFKDYSSSLPENVFVQPKLDGIRCIASNQELLTRRNSYVTSCSHIQEKLKGLTNNILLDGELVHPTGFQQTCSFVRSIKPKYGSEKIEYHVFDIIDLENPDLKQTDRFELLHLVFLTNPILRVETRFINKSGIDEFHEESKALGYEGTIIRDPNGIYNFNTRSTALLKRKDRMDAEFKIVDVISGEGSHLGAAIFILQDNRGRRFKSSLKTSIANKKSIYKNRNKYYGWIAHIEFQEYTDDMFPRQPVAIDWRPEYV